MVTHLARKAHLIRCSRRSHVKLLDQRGQILDRILLAAKRAPVEGKTP